MLRPKYSSNRVFVSSSFLVSCILIAISAFFIFNKQSIVDQITVWQYKPSNQIVALAERAGMNDRGKFIFYASQPKLDSTSDFNKECDRIENDTSILGCYTGSHIYIYDVTDVKLDGIREVTAAHETLHAAYFRLSESEKTRINKLIDAEYVKLKGDNDFNDLMAFYDRTEPGQRNNELHSIIGTEVSSINSELEAYYDSYFSDRQKVVSLNASYIGEFKTLKLRDEELTRQLDELYATITADKIKYEADVISLNADISSFNDRASGGDFTTQSEFYYERSLLLNRASELDALRTTINENISKYDVLLAEHNSIATMSKKLYNLIDSTLAPTPTI